MLTTPANIKKMLDAQQLAINANVDVKAGETQAHVTTKANATNVEVANKATDTQNVIVADGDTTQGQLAALTLVNGDIDTNVQAINAHVTTENDRVLANIPSGEAATTDIHSPYSRIPTGALAGVILSITVEANQMIRLNFLGASGSVAVPDVTVKMGDRTIISGSLDDTNGTQQEGKFSVGRVTQSGDEFLGRKGEALEISVLANTTASIFYSYTIVSMN